MVAAAPHPLSVLAAGADTGGVTRSLLSQLPRGSLLDVVEADPRFATQLRRLVAAHPAPAGGPGPVTVTVHQICVGDLDTGHRHDVIVSALPLTKFTPGQVERIMARYMELLHPGGTLTYSTHVGMRRLRALTVSRSEARRCGAVSEIMDAYQRSYATGRTTVWASLPPANVWRLQRPCVLSDEQRQTRDGVGQ